MLRMSIVVMVLCVSAVLSQVPSPCAVPTQFSGRASQHDHEDDHLNRYYFAYDAATKRRVLFEEQNVMTPGRQFREFLELGLQNVLYEINLTLKTCIKTPMRQAWRPWGIPPNATFETEYYIGGPGEEVFAQEWSDRIPNRQREYWIGVYSLKNCYPIREIILADYQQHNYTITTNFYDIVEGIPNPNDFIPPPECLHAKWFPRPSGKLPHFF